MNRRGIQLVCFDIGGVLAQICKDWPDACARAGVHIPPNRPLAWDQHLALLRQFEVGRIDEPSYIRQLPTCLPGIAPADVLKAFDAFIIGIFPGAADLIDQLQSSSIRTAILSNTNHRHWRSVLRDPQYAPLLRIDHIFTSYELGAAKPDPRAYRAVESATALSPSSILFFDDRDENVQGARSAGWKAELIDPLSSIPQLRAHLAHYRVGG
jgi:HAD superfamily hydrolase (TIGR01509 family)